MKINWRRFFHIHWYNMVKSGFWKYVECRCGHRMARMGRLWRGYEPLDLAWLHENVDCSSELCCPPEGNCGWKK